MGTIQNSIDRKERIFAHCEGGNNCFHSQELDLEALKTKLGPDAPAMRDDLLPRLKCARCGGKDVGLTYRPDTAPTGNLASPYAKANGQ